MKRWISAALGAVLFPAFVYGLAQLPHLVPFKVIYLFMQGCLWLLSAAMGAGVGWIIWEDLQPNDKKNHQETPPRDSGRVSGGA